MNRLLLSITAATFALSGCASTEPPTFEQNTNDIYVWDDSKSTALNWADIARDKHGIRDAKNAEDAQDLVTGAESAGWTLFSFATGGAGFGLGVGALMGEIEDNQNWRPTHILLTQQQNLTNPDTLLAEVEKLLAPMFEKSHGFSLEGVVWKFRRGNHNASLLISGKQCLYTSSYVDMKDRYMDLPENYNKCFMEVDIDVRPAAQLLDGDGNVYNVITVEHKAYISDVLSLAALSEYPVLFPTNYRVGLNGEDANIPFPFVLKNSDALLFTTSNVSMPLNVAN